MWGVVFTACVVFLFLLPMKMASHSVLALPSITLCHQRVFHTFLDVESSRSALRLLHNTLCIYVGFSELLFIS